MYEGIIETLLKLFAIVTDFRSKSSTESSVLVESYLKENFNRELVEKYLVLYRNYVNYYHLENREIFYEDGGEGKRFINKNYLNDICNGIVDHFDLNTRFMIVSQLLNFINREEGVNIEDLKMVNVVARGLKIDPQEYDNLYRFFLFSIDKVKDKSCLFVVNGNLEYHDKQINHLYRENQQVELELIRIQSTNTLFFKYWGPRNLYLNGHRLEQQRLYIFPPGGILKTSRIIPIYYSSVMTRFIQEKGKARIVLNAENIEYRFSKRVYGLHPLSFQERSGDLVGILGGSGVGKTTLLNVLNGKLKPSAGKITLNGYDLHDPQNEDILKGVIGYVPQDDLLLEELTVYQNLEFNARFCFGNMTDEQIGDIIQQTLVDFDLVEARDLVVGNPLKKILSGGQRKRLNIALELMREPSILFVDEPTSGLSSADSEKVMYLLKRQCLKGRLVFANIHQPSSDIYKLFDRMIVMDKGGRVVFFGNPMEAITHFKHLANYVNPDESECMACGNVKTEQPLRIIEARMVDPFGESIRRRKIAPEEWYQHYKEKVEPRVVEFMRANPVKEERFPEVIFKTPSWFRQLKLFVQRDFASKRSNKQYLAIALLEAPILAIILGFFSKFSDAGRYLVSENDNIPAFLFMSVVVALFIGLSISAEEIFKDRKIRKREEFLDLSRGAYFASKILMLFMLSAIQVISFVLIGHYMLEIRELTFSTWAILFSTACFANLLGLNLSAGLDSAVAIYVLIPLMLVPQLLLSGVIVDFNKMHYSLSSYDKTPLIGDVMVSRWSYEALAVNQFKNNPYREYIFDEELAKNDMGFRAYYWLPEVDKYLKNYQRLLENKEPEEALLLEPVLKNSFDDLRGLVTPNNDTVDLAIAAIGQPQLSKQEFSLLKDYLEQAKKSYQKDYQTASAALDDKYGQLLARFEGDQEQLLNFKNKYVNKKLEALLRDKYSLHKLYVSDNRIYQGDEPIYRQPVCRNGRAHFYSAYKFLGSLRIETYLFNMLVMWVFSGLLMVALYFDLLRKIIAYVERWRLTRQAELRDRIFYNPMAFMKGDRKRKQNSSRSDR
ncbi:ATP-binding cassette domain-containing protein [Gaoshiqia sediminis]|uniref:ATP-binding cassette domain-containing protein n=1 Tax=Gaoshiqia sediminis TaxID=2986998 RepID=A0AA41Y9I3_9BACT|nr:ATP-binding cassette domain-containing protein [Gaoshiqia sediminis]MCW0481913.1 ATP-binding cassette domain-containing protein [Gaoshiqia sediminis]